MIKKNLVNIQLDLELQKFGEAEDNCNQNLKQFDLTLQKLIIEPYG